MNGLTRFVRASLLGIGSAIAGATVSAAVETHQPTPAGARLGQLNDTLRRSHAEGNVAEYLSTAQMLHTFLNGSPPATLQLISAESFAGEQEYALRSLKQFVAMGQEAAATLQKEQFKALRSAPEFQVVEAVMAANSSPISTATEVFHFDAKVQLPEDIDYDRGAKRFYISSVLGKNIMAVDMAGRARVFAAAPDSWPVLALKIDAARGVLWATEVALAGFASVPQKDWGSSAVLLYDLKSGSLMKRVAAPPQTALGDMVLEPDGDAIVADGENGGLYRVSRKTPSMVRIDGGDFISPQTPAMLPDGRHVLVPDYVRGLGVLDLETKHVTWIPMEGRHALSGIDGLYLVGNQLLATQNGTSPERVVRFMLNGSGNRVLAETVIERATLTLGDPTHGVVVGKYFYYIANSGWNTLDDHGVLKEGQIMPTPLLMRARRS